MKKTHGMKMLCCALSLCLLAALFAGCSAASGSQSTAPSAASVSDGPQTAADGEEITLTVACNVDNQEAFDAFFAAFEQAHPNISIDFVQWGAGEENSFIQSRLASNTLPDVIGISAGSFGSQLADEGVLYDLTGSVAAERMLPSALGSYTSPGGSVYAITYGLSTTVLYYNADLFAEKKLAPPQNWQEFLDVCAALKAEGITPLSIAAGDASIGNTMWSYGFGNNMAGKDWKESMANGTIDLDIPEVEDIFVRLKTLDDAGYLQNGAVSADYNASNELFLQGQTAMLFAGIWFNGVFADADFTVRACVPPLNEGDGQCTVVATETGWAVNADSPHLDEALLLMDFFTGEGYAILQNARQSVPAVKDTSTAKVSDIVADFMPNFDNAAVTAPLYYEYLPGVFQSDLCKIFQDVLNDNITPAEAAKKCQELYKSAFAA